MPGCWSRPTTAAISSIETTVRRWLESFRVSARSRRGGARTPARRSCLWSSDDEARRLLVEWNDTAAVYPAIALVHQIVEDWAARTPDAPAVVCGRTPSDLGRVSTGAPIGLARLLVKAGVKTRRHRRALPRALRRFRRRPARRAQGRRGLPAARSRVSARAAGARDRGCRRVRRDRASSSAGDLAGGGRRGAASSTC